MLKRKGNFGVNWRNPGHWDIYENDGRAFRIRGHPGDVRVYDERQDGRPYPRGDKIFKSVQAAMAWICDELMFEHIAELGDEMVDSAGYGIKAVRNPPAEVHGDL